MPSPAEEVASLFIKTDEPDEVDVTDGLAAFSIRSPVSRLAQIDAMAAHASLSRNAMANELLRVGISSVFSCLPDEIRDEIFEDAADRISNS